jgi:hypothetical protein
MDISDIKQLRSQYHPADDTSAVGGAVTAAEITGIVSGEVVPVGSMFVSNTTQTYFYKTFIKNTHAVDVAYDVKVWIANGLTDLDTAGRIEIVSTSADDATPKHARVIGVVGGSETYEDVPLNGTTPVVTTQTFSAVRRVQLRSGDAMANASGDIQIRRQGGSILGIIPQSFSMATAEVEIGLAPSSNDTATSTNRRTPPAGVTFSRPTDEANALTLGDLSAGVAWGIWRKYTFAPNVLKPSLLQVVIGIRALV